MEFPNLKKLKILFHEPHWIVNNEPVCKASDIERMLSMSQMIWTEHRSLDQPISKANWSTTEMPNATHCARILMVEPITKKISKRVIVEALKMQGALELAENVEKYGVGE